MVKEKTRELETAFVFAAGKPEDIFAHVVDLGYRVGPSGSMIKNRPAVQAPVMKSAPILGL